MRNINDELTRFTNRNEGYAHIDGNVYTEGVKYLSVAYKCNWLINFILLEQKIDEESEEIDLGNEKYQVWLMTGKKGKGELLCMDGQGLILYTKHFPYTTFDGRVTLIFQDKILHLPSEI